MKQDVYCYPWAVPLKLYITDKHDNNVSAFARSQGVQPNQVNRWLKRDCVVINGVVYCEVSKANKSNKKAN